MGRTSIIVVAYNHGGYIAACVRALDAAGLDAATTRLILVDNASTDGTAAIVRREVLGADGNRTRGGLPVLFFENRENLGFSGGNNLALRCALDEGDEFAYLLNPDTEVERGFLDAAIEVARADDAIAQVQSLLVRHPERDVVNTWGNAIHFLGFGYAAGDGTRLDDPAAAAHLAGVHDVGYASGAGCLIRLSVLREIGLLDEDLFAYHEDLELSWRARLAGHRIVIAPRSRVAHKYAFSRNRRKFFFMERNRFLVMVSCYRVPTWLLLLPAMAMMEVGLWLFAMKGGWLSEKWKAYVYFLDPDNWMRLRATRRRVQALRRVDDKTATALFVGEVIFPAVNPWLLTRVANPLFAAYWRLVRWLIRW